MHTIKYCQRLQHYFPKFQTRKLLQHTSRLSCYGYIHCCCSCWASICCVISSIRRCMYIGCISEYTDIILWFTLTCFPTQRSTHTVCKATGISVRKNIHQYLQVEVILCTPTGQASVCCDKHLYFCENSPGQYLSCKMIQRKGIQKDLFLYSSSTYNLRKCLNEETNL